MNKEKMFHFFWGGAFIALPLFLKAGKQIALPRHAHEMGFLFLVFISVFLFGFFSETNPKERIIFGAFLSLVFFNTVNFTAYTYISQFFSIAATLALGLQFRSVKKDYLYIILNGIAISCIIQCIFSVLPNFNIYLFDFYSMDVKVNYQPFGSVGTFDNQGSLGSYLAISLPVFFRKKWIFFTPVILICLYFTSATTPFIVLGAILGAYFFKNIAKFYWILPIVGVLGTIALVKSGLVENHRIQIWNLIIHRTGLNNLFIGSGTAYIIENSLLWKTYGMKANQAHNEYIELFYHYGLLGLGIVTIYIKKFYKQTNPLLIAMLLGSFVSSLTHFNLHITGTAMLFILALCYRTEGAKNV